MKNNNPLFIVFEGSDGCGKSSISKMLAEELKAEWRTTPDECLASERKKIDTLYKGSGLALQLFYASANAYASTLAEEYLGKKTSLVMDRYWASTIAYDTIVRNSGIKDNVWMNVIFNNILVPDFTIYLSVSPKVRKERMDARGELNLTDEESIKEAGKLDCRYKELFRKFSPKTGEMLFISNENTEKECLTEIMNKIQKITNA